MCPDCAHPAPPPPRSLLESDQVRRRKAKETFQGEEGSMARDFLEYFGRSKSTVHSEMHAEQGEPFPAALGSTPTEHTPGSMCSARRSWCQNE